MIRVRKNKIQKIKAGQIRKRGNVGCRKNEITMAGGKGREDRLEVRKKINVKCWRVLFFF